MTRLTPVLISYQTSRNSILFFLLQVIMSSNSELTLNQINDVPTRIHVYNTLKGSFMRIPLKKSPQRRGFMPSNLQHYTAHSQDLLLAHVAVTIKSCRSITNRLSINLFGHCLHMGSSQPINWFITLSATLNVPRTLITLKLHVWVGSLGGGRVMDCTRLSQSH